MSSSTSPTTSASRARRTGSRRIRENVPPARGAAGDRAPPSRALARAVSILAAWAFIDCIPLRCRSDSDRSCGAWLPAMDEPAPGRDAVARALVQLRSARRNALAAPERRRLRSGRSVRGWSDCGRRMWRSRRHPIREKPTAPVDHQANGFVTNRPDLSVLTSPEVLDSGGVSST